MDGEKSDFVNTGGGPHILHVPHYVIFQNIPIYSANIEKIRQRKSCTGKYYNKINYKSKIKTVNLFYYKIQFFLKMF